MFSLFLKASTLLDEMVSSAAHTLLQLAFVPLQQEGPPVSAERSDLASRPLQPSAVGLASAGPDLLLSDCVDPVSSLNLNARPFTWLQHEWKLFSDRCTDRSEDPARCSVPSTLEFLQSLLDDG